MWRMIACVGVGGFMAACGSYASYVETDDAALGRVVVYRNGIAYYERMAEVHEGTVTMTVPHDKVDDFLKSLTVNDAKTGATLPVAFQTQGATADGKVDMTVQVDDPNVTNVVLTYITESPAWKPSYRVMLDGDDVAIQGWAIVDNTSGEKWDRVRVGVGSSSALSFRYDLRSVRNVHRETLKSDEQFAAAPPTGGTTHKGQGDRGQLLAALDTSILPDDEAADIADDAPVADSYELEPASTVGTLSREHISGGGKALFPRRKSSPVRDRKDAARLAKAQQQARERAARKAAADQKKRAQAAQVVALAEKLKNSSGQVTIEGYADAGERDGDLRSSDRANWVRNELIRNGVAPARIKVDARGHVAGKKAGVQLVQATSPAGPRDVIDDGQPIGESHFQSDAPVTVDKGTSAMIAVLDDKATGDVVYLYDAESDRGNTRYAFKAIRFENPTESTLESGPMTVYGQGRFIGEGLTEPIPPNSTALVPFALDRQVIAERESATEDRISRLITLQRGVLRTEVQHTRRRIVKLTSVLHRPTDVFVRHTVRKGWALTKNPHFYERSGDAHLFKIVLEPGETRTVTIEESTPLVRTVNLRTPEGLALVRAYLRTDGVAERFAEPMKKLVALHSDMADIRDAILAARDRVGEYRGRMGELQTQIVSLGTIRGGASLMRHLQAKLKDMSNRVQKDTIGIVNLQEKLMLTRIKFQDGVAELSLDRRAVSDAGDDGGDAG